MGIKKIIISTVGPEEVTDKTVTFESKDNNVATVDESGNVEAIGVGTTVITVKCGDIEVECKVTVNPKLTVINSAPMISAEDVTINVGDNFEVMNNITATDKEDGDITSTIKVIENTVDTTKAGEYKVVYKVIDSEGASTTKTITVTVQEVINDSVVVEPENTPENSGDNNTSNNTNGNNESNNDANNSNNVDNSNSLPQTGDNSAAIVVILALVVIVAGVFMFKKKK